jgi:hypothetical protein
MGRPDDLRSLADSEERFNADPDYPRLLEADRIQVGPQQFVVRGPLVAGSPDVLRSSSQITQVAGRCSLSAC